MEFIVGGYSNIVNTVFALKESKSGTLLAFSFVERARVACKSIVACVASGKPCHSRYNTRDIYNPYDQKYSVIYKPIIKGRDKFQLVTMVNKKVGVQYLLTDAAHLDEDFFHFLMCNYHLPLKEDWMPALREALLDKMLIEHPIKGNASAELDTKTALHGRDIRVEEILVFDFRSLAESILTEEVSSLIKSGTITVADQQSEPLQVSSMDEYITRYGSTLVKNLEGTVETLSPLKGDLDGFVAKTKRLYPQQAACINGVIALKNAGSRYGFMVEGMGCGKTLQGAAVVDAVANQRWLNRHPGKTLRDMYRSDDQPTYRSIMMAPSHLVYKWRDEILNEVPGTRVTILNDLSQLIELREKGAKRTGREWYLISKDFGKLGTMDSPIPMQTARMVPKGVICKDCYETTREVNYKQGLSSRVRCKQCGGRNFMAQSLKMRPIYGMVCPDCGNLLIRYSSTYYMPEDPDQITLKPRDFAAHNNLNDRCYVCGAHLWGVNCRPVGGERPEKYKKWYKVTHWKNYQHKGRTSAFVLKGHEEDYYVYNQVEREGIKRSPVEYGPRRFAPSLFIKKYLKGYFDYAILDEAHKYEAGGSAQSIAAHALMKVSDFTLCLTGTISNGKADSFFYLLYMLDPRRMKKMGYAHHDVMNFVNTYGAVETMYEAGGNEDGRRNASSRGRQIGSPRVKPGISPLLFMDFLLDKSVFLDLSDMSKYLPPLKEQVVSCKCPDMVRRSYQMVVESLKEESHRKNGGGMAILSTMLQFALSYPDKPYGYQPIMSPRIKDEIICNVPSFKEYAEGELLPKEEKLIGIVRNEIAEDRNVFVYCAYTGAAEMNVTERIKQLIERKANLRGQVLIMQASSPKATEREAYIKQKAAEGIRVFICNLKLVETGLDFCFSFEGAYYNYPTIIFYQITYELAAVWQASRRHYRLNQKEECRTYYMVTEGTMQMGAVQVMAEKQVAASAIQGKFSADGLAAMANGVDPRIKLARMLSENDTGDRESIENMFDVLNASGADAGEDERYGDYTPPMTYYELMDGELFAATESDLSIFAQFTSFMSLTGQSDAETAQDAEEMRTMMEEKPAEEREDPTIFSIFDFMQGTGAGMEETITQFTAAAAASTGTGNTGKSGKRKKSLPDQMSIFDLAA